jgi:hypothetical protein
MTTTTPTATHVKSPAGRPPDLVGDFDEGDLGEETVLATMLLVTGVASNLVDVRAHRSRWLLM